MIDFDKAKKLPNKFGGSELKSTVLLDNIIYMIKRPDPIKAKSLREAISYKNNHFSEYLGSNIFSLCGFKTQNVKLGYFTDHNGKRKIVVGCEDFTQDGSKLYEFAVLVKPYELELGKPKTRIEDIYEVISKEDFIKNKLEILDNFWDIFVIDALIGNSDRHLGNWGVIEKSGKISFAPVYDCGSALGATLDDNTMKKILDNPILFKANEFNKTSNYTFRNQKIFYHEMFNKPSKALAFAILRIVPRIDIPKIHELVNNTPELSEVRKEYINKSIDLRFNDIIMKAYKKISKLNNEQVVTPKKKQTNDDGMKM